MSQPVRSTTEIAVRYAETDQMGVVHHANYLVWFEQARTDLCLLSGFHYAEIEKAGYYLVVSRFDLRLAASAHYGETVTVTCWLDHLASRRLRFAYEVHHESKLLVSGKTEHIWVAIATGRPSRTPALVAQPFARLAGSSG